MRKMGTTPQEARPAWPIAASTSLKGSPERRVYIQIGGIEQEGVLRFSQGGRAPALVAFIPAHDIGQDFCLGNRRFRWPGAPETPPGPNLQAWQ